MAGNGVLVIGEPSEASVASATLEALGAARELAGKIGGPVAVAVLGQDVEGQAQGLIERGADRVDVLSDPRLAAYQADTWVPALAALVQETNPSVVLLSHTQTGREFGTRLAFRLGTGIVTDCSDLQVADNGRLLVIKPVFGGNAVAEYTVAGDGVQLASLRPKLFDQAAPVPGHQGEVAQRQVQIDPG